MIIDDLAPREIKDSEVVQKSSDVTVRISFTSDFSMEVRFYIGGTKTAWCDLAYQPRIRDVRTGPREL
jgi:hypothetical protein